MNRQKAATRIEEVSSLLIDLDPDCLGKQLATRPLRSFLRLDFRRIMSYILAHQPRQTMADQALSGLDVQQLEYLIEDLQTSFDTICDQDYRELVKMFNRSTSQTKPNPNRKAARQFDPKIILSWGLMESAKYCLSQKLAPELKSANLFLTLLKDELNKPIQLDRQFNLTALLRFLEYLDRLIFDRTSESSHRKHSHSLADNVEQFIDANSGILRSWFYKNRQITATSALVLGYPAECWRSIGIRLWCDMITKFSTMNQQSFNITTATTNSNRISLTQTLISLDAKQWRANLELYALCAKSLGDSDLLHGLKSLVDLSGVLGEEWTLIDLITNNLECHYSRTHEEFLNRLKDSDLSKDIEQTALVEFLNSCIELDKLETHSDKIALLQSPNLKNLYEQYLASTRELKGSVHYQSSEKFHEIRSWLNTWTFDPATHSGTTETISSLINLSLPTLINQVCLIDCDSSRRKELLKVLSNDLKVRSTGASILSLYQPDLGDAAHMEGFLESMIEQSSSPLIDRLDSNLRTRSSLATRNDQLIYRLNRNLNHSRRLDTFVNQRDFDELQLNAVKFNLKKGNKAYAIDLAIDLDQKNPADEEIRLENRLVLREAIKRDDCLKDMINAIKTSSINKQRKSRLLSIAFCKASSNKQRSGLVKLLELTFSDSPPGSSSTKDLDDTSDIKLLTDLVGAHDLSHKTLSVLARSIDDELAIINDTTHGPTDEHHSLLLNTSFKIDLVILVKLCDNGLDLMRQGVVVKSASKILDRIKLCGDRLDAANLATFSSKVFIEKTVDKAWFNMRDTIISIVTCCCNVPQVWVEALTQILQCIATTRPESVLYETIVNRFDLKYRLANYTHPLEKTAPETSILLQQGLILPNPKSGQNPSSGSSRPMTESDRRQVAFWEDIYKTITDDATRPESWRAQVSGTETFLSEIRKISYLSGEYFTTMITRMDIRLWSYLNLFKKHAELKTGRLIEQKHIDECRVKLVRIYQYESRSMEILRNYCERLKSPSSTLYDQEIIITLTVPLEKLDQLFQKLIAIKRPTLKENETLIGQIRDIISKSYDVVNKSYHNLKRGIYMEQISPFLSRLKPELVLMPDFYTDGIGQSTCMLQAGHQSPITIFKVSQNVQLIYSKTSPKKLTFIGSDGRSRSYLLKAHEDLRLDKLVMNLFGSINLLLRGDKGTRKYNYCLQRFAVTPVSNRSGLIQWVEAPPLRSAFKLWFSSANGQRTIGRLFKETCQYVCPDPSEEDEEKHHCVLRSPVRGVDVFYQLLWAKLRSLSQQGSHATCYDKMAKPDSDFTSKHRSEETRSIYEDIVERLITTLPQDLITQQLWFDSSHSMHHYLKTREFTRSCATASIAGYIIGLGDRHPDNILLDPKSGSVVHIDYNLCFEVGQRLSVGERVPFRLTQSMVHAFGFAGLEGGFKRSCERVLGLMKQYKSVVLHYLSPINLSFLVGARPANDRGEPSDNTLLQLAKGDDDNDSKRRARLEAVKAKTEDSASSESGARRHFAANKTSDDKLLAPTAVAPLGMDLRSQEDDGSPSEHDVVKTSESTRQPLAKKLVNKQNQGQSSPDRVLFNIKTPTRISPKHARDVYGRVERKLLGKDELLMASRRMALPAGKSADARRRRMSCGSGDHIHDVGESKEQTASEDSLIDVGQSNEDQVDALILEAISIRNKAAMYEGWSAWI